MDRTNKKLLDGEYKRALQDNKQRFFQEEIHRLSTSGKSYTSDELKSKATAIAENKVTQGKPQLEANIYQDFGGSQEAAQKEFKNWQRKKVEKYLEERKQRPENQKKPEQKKAIQSDAQQKAAASLARMKKRQERKGNFNNLSKGKKI